MRFVAPSSTTQRNGGAAKPRCKLPQKPCAKCGTDIDARVKSGLCNVCVRKPCLDCGKLTGPKNTSGCCIRCNTLRMNADPVLQRHRAEGLRHKYATDPEYAEKIRKVAQRMGRKYGIDEEVQARRIAFGKHAYATWLSRPDVKAKALATRKAMADKMRAIKLPWCPPEYYEMHNHLLRRKKLRAAEVREIIERHIANDRALKHVDSALDFLRKFAPVQKLEEGFRYGNAVLTPAEVINRATVRGWKPEALAA